MVSVHSVVDSEKVNCPLSKGQNAGGETELRKGLVEQIKGLVGKFHTTLYGKNALHM